MKLMQHLAIVGFILSVAIIAVAIARAGRTEYDEEDEDAPGDYESITYSEILECERPYIEHMYN